MPTACKLAEDAAKKWGQVVVLKGATTVVADLEGRSMVNDGGNAALATAGTGDVLAGAIAGLLAQGLTPFDAATLGVTCTARPAASCATTWAIWARSQAICCHACHWRSRR